MPRDSFQAPIWVRSNEMDTTGALKAKPDDVNQRALSVDELYTTIPNFQPFLERNRTEDPSEPTLTENVLLDRLSEYSSYTVAVVGLFGLASWLLGVLAPASFLSFPAPIKPDLSIGITACGVALYLLRDNGPGTRNSALSYVGVAATVTAFVASLISLVRFVYSGPNDLIIPSHPNAVSIAFFEQTIPVTSICLLLTALALLFLRRKIGSVNPGEPIAVVVMFIALISLAVYAYDLGRLDSIPAVRAAALLTAIALFVVSLGTLFANRRHRLPYLYASKGPSGILVRRLLPAVVFVPLTIGGLRVIGQQMDFYGTEIGIALFAVSNIVVLVALLWLTARAVHTLEAEIEVRDRRIARSREHLELALGTAEIGAWDYDLTTKKVCRTLRHDEIFGYKTMRPEWTINDLIEHLHPEDRPRLDEIKELLRESGGFTAEARIKTAQGHERRIWARGRRLHTEDGFSHIVGVISDITERRNAEEDRKRIFERITDAFIAFDRDYNFTFINRNAAELLNRRSEDLIGKNMWAEFPEGLGSGFEEAYERARKTQTPTVHEEFYGPLGSWIEIRIFPSDQGMSVYVHDVTERREGQENLRRLNEALELRVEERTRDLKAVNRELEAFAHSVSHDLRAPLRAIDGFSAAVIEDHSDTLNDEAIGYLRRVRRASRNMGELIDDLLRLSRVSRTEMKTDRLDLTMIAERVIERLREADPDRRIEVRITEGLTATGDEALVRSLLENLLSNAWKFTSKTENALIVLDRIERQDAELFYVRDNGAGFDMKYRDKLFNAFQRLHSPAEFDGTGIGLATVLRIVDRHGGSVDAEGEPGKGATFYFSLN